MDPSLIRAAHQLEAEHSKTAGLFAPHCRQCNHRPLPPSTATPPPAAGVPTALHLRLAAAWWPMKMKRYAACCSPEQPCPWRAGPAPLSGAEAARREPLASRLRRRGSVAAGTGARHRRGRKLCTHTEHGGDDSQQFVSRAPGMLRGDDSMIVSRTYMHGCMAACMCARGGRVFHTHVCLMHACARHGQPVAQPYRGCARARDEAINASVHDTVDGVVRLVDSPGTHRLDQSAIPRGGASALPQQGRCGHVLVRWVAGAMHTGHACA